LFGVRRTYQHFKFRRSAKPLYSLCRYIKIVRTALEKLHIPGMIQDYNISFSIFDGKLSIENLPVCMPEAIGFKP
jgi:endoglucanase